MEHGGEAFVVVDHDGRITQVNRAYERIFGRPRQAVLSQQAGPAVGLPADTADRMALAARGGPWGGTPPPEPQREKAVEGCHHLEMP